MPDYRWRPSIYALTSQNTGDMEIIPGGIQNLGWLQVNGTFSAGDTTITAVADRPNRKGIAHIKPGMIFYAQSQGYTDNITTVVSVDVGNSTITVADAPSTNNSGQLIAVYPQKGMSFIESGSISVPTGNTSIFWTQITGSGDSEFDQGFKWGVGGGLAKTSSYNSTQTATNYGYYEIFSIQDRVSSTIASFYVTESIEAKEPADSVLYSPTNVPNLALVSLSDTGSIPPLFHGSDASVSEGLGIGSYNPTIASTYDYIDANNFPFSGSAQITGSLGVTGSIELEKGEAETDFFLIKSASFTPLKLNSDGVAVFGGFSSLPTAVEGGLAYSASNFYAGIE